MSYEYEKQRERLFTDDGQRLFLKVRDRAKLLLKQAGAFRMSECLHEISGDSWDHLACLDRLVELGEIVELKRDSAWAQFRVFTAPETNNR